MSPIPVQRIVRNVPATSWCGRAVCCIPCVPELRLHIRREALYYALARFSRVLPPTLGPGIEGGSRGIATTRSRANTRCRGLSAFPVLPQRHPDDWTTRRSWGVPSRLFPPWSRMSIPCET